MKAFAGAVVVIGLAFLAVGGFGHFKQWARVKKVRNLAQSAAAGICRNRADCKTALEPNVEPCVLAATKPRENVEFKQIDPVDAKTLKVCLQKNFFRFACKNSKRCLAQIDGRYDECHAHAYPEPARPERKTPPSAVLVACLYGFGDVELSADGAAGGGDGGGEAVRTDGGIAALNGGGGNGARGVAGQDGSGGDSGDSKGIMDTVNGLTSELSAAGKKRQEDYADAMKLLAEIRGDKPDADGGPDGGAPAPE